MVTLPTPRPGVRPGVRPDAATGRPANPALEATLEYRAPAAPRLAPPDDVVICHGRARDGGRPRAVVTPAHLLAADVGGAPRTGRAGLAIGVLALAAAGGAVWLAFRHLSGVPAMVAAVVAVLSAAAVWAGVVETRTGPRRPVRRAGGTRGGARHWRTAAAAAPLLAVGACASAPPRVASTTFFPQALEARPADAPVRLYQGTRPACAYDEVGNVKVKGGDFKDADKLAEAMRQRVRQMGGDAIVNFGKQEVVTGQSGMTNGMMGGAWMGGPWMGGWPGPVMQDVRNNKTLVLTGTVVRFRDLSCPTRTDGGGSARPAD